MATESRKVHRYGYSRKFGLGTGLPDRTAVFVRVKIGYEGDRRRSAENKPRGNTMKLVRYGKPGKEKPGLIDSADKLRDLTDVVADVAGDALSPQSLARLRKIEPESLPLVRGKPRLGACVGKVGNFVAVGLNYADHAAESNMPIPKEPILFNKAPSCIVGPNDDVVIPKGSVKTDWEVELAIVIGARASYVGEAEALDHVAGYCVCNDVSERTYQLEGTGQWMKGKG